MKGGGWQGQRSRVWQPDHADRLVLVLALAYAWALTQGTLVLDASNLLRRVTRGARKRFSVFRCGLLGLMDDTRHTPEVSLSMN